MLFNNLINSSDRSLALPGEKGKEIFLVFFAARRKMRKRRVSLKPFDKLRDRQNQDYFFDSKFPFKKIRCGKGLDKLFDF